MRTINDLFHCQKVLSFNCEETDCIHNAHLFMGGHKMLSGRCGNCFDQLNIKLSAFALPWAANGDDGGTHTFVDQFEESIDVAGGVTA